MLYLCNIVHVAKETLSRIYSLFVTLVYLNAQPAQCGMLPACISAFQ